VKRRRKGLGPGFADYGMALQAALDGVGVAIGLRPWKMTSPSGAWLRRFRFLFPENGPGTWCIVRSGKPIPAIAFRDGLRKSFHASS